MTMTKGEMALSKTFSARFLMAIMLTGTACYGFIIGKLPDEAFTALVGAAVTAYFMKGNSDDMKPKEPNDNKAGIA